MSPSKSNIKPPQLEAPAIDVVVNFVDEFNHVGKAINSLRKSKGVKVRILIIDDSGKDNSEFFSRSLSSHDLYKRSNQRGYISALKFADTFLESQFVGILNADDISDERRLISQVSKLGSGLDICVGRLVKFKWITWLHLPSVTRSQLKGQFCSHLMYLGPLSADATWVMRRETFGILFESRFNSDWGIALEKFQGLRIGFDLKSKYYYRQHSKQTTRGSTLLFNAECDFIRDRIEEDFHLQGQDGFVESLATSWKSSQPIALDLFEEFTLNLRKQHKLMCRNFKSFDREVIRRLLIAAVRPRNFGRSYLRLRIFATYPLETFKFISVSAMTLLLRTGRKS
jgi:glycosyltransferase involved in cell wall biosynthesis